MTENEKEMFDLLKVSYDCTRYKDTTWATRTRAILEKLGPKPPEYRAKWPEHAGCLMERSTRTGERALAIVESPIHEGRRLYTSLHKLNMIPHDGWNQPVDAEQLVIIEFRGEVSGFKYKTDFAENFFWQYRRLGNEELPAHIISYCPIDPVRVDL